MDISAVDEVLSTTRAVRRRLDLTRPVEREVVLDCLRLAGPGAHSEQRSELALDGGHRSHKRSAIADVYRSCGEEYLAYAARTTPDPQTKKVYESAHALSHTLAQVPVHVIPCIEGRLDSTELVVAASVWASIIPAAWSFMLALRARGLGSVWTTLHLSKADEVAELLDIPDNVTQVALLPVAYTIGTDFKPAVRPPVETVTSWNTWGTR